MRTDKVKVLYIHNIPQISGGERSLLNLWENLDRGQFEPLLMVPQEGELSRAAQQMGVSVVFLEIPQLHPKNIVLLLQTASHLLHFLRSNHIHIIHSYAPRNNILSALVAKCAGASVIWHERNLIYGDEKDRSKQFFVLPVRIICNSKATAQRFEQIKDHSSKVRVVLNGVNLEKFKPLQDAQLKTKLGLDGMKVAGMVSNLNQRKGLASLIEAMPLVVAKVSSAKFLIVGGEFPDEGGQRLKELQGLAENLGVQKHIVFTGFQDDVRPFLNILDVLVHVTIKEACSRAIIEAMACGKPVIAINDGGNPELVDDGKTGILVRPNDREALATAIIVLLSDEGKRAAMGQEGRRRAEQLFDVKRNAKETQAIYLECQA